MKRFAYKCLITYRTMIYCALALSLGANYLVYTGKLARGMSALETATACGDMLTPMQAAEEIKAAQPVKAQPHKKGK